MTSLTYKCMKCGTCCFEIEGQPGSKRIPLYPEEVDVLIEIAKERGVEFNVIEDLVFPDVLNQKLLVVTYKIRLNNPKTCCPFYSLKKGCTIHQIKPFACQAYPLSLIQLDAFNFQISIDSSCPYVIKYHEILNNCGLDEIKEIFKDEYPKAERFYRKNKKIMLKIHRLEYKKKIKIPRNISIKEFNNALEKWDRVELRVK